jgi:hypothetical protein
MVESQVMLENGNGIDDLIWRERRNGRKDKR